VGVSAGSIIIGPSIDIANEINSDSNEVGLTDLTGLGITKLIILPHYDSKMEKETKIFETKHNVFVERLADSQALLVTGSNKILIK
jgi:dipeptidase E